MTTPVSEDILRQQVNRLRQERQALVDLQELPLGDLQLDVEQTLADLDALLAECDRTFSPTT